MALPANAGARHNCCAAVCLHVQRFRCWPAGLEAAGRGALLWCCRSSAAAAPGSTEARERVLQEIQASVAAAKAEASAGSGCWQRAAVAGSRMGTLQEHESEQGADVFEGLDAEQVDMGVGDSSTSS